MSTQKSIKSGQPVWFVPRETLRRKTPVRTLVIPSHLRQIASTIPSTPATLDSTLGGALQFPAQGNTQYGCCLECSTSHQIGVMTGDAAGAAAELVYTTAQVLGVYAAITGFNPQTGANDNGTTVDQMNAYWKNPGMPGGQTILDEMAIAPSDIAGINLAQYRFRAVGITLAVPDAWVAEAAPGCVWDAGAGVTADPNNGHGLAFSGYQANGYQSGQTWGFAPGIWITPAGLLVCDAEVQVSFSRSNYNAQGISAAGFTYEQDAALWQTLGGNPLPPWTPAPAPGPAPAPPNPSPSPFQVEVDQVFAYLENALAAYPQWVTIIKTGQAYVDQALAQWPNWYGVAIGFSRASQAYPQYAGVYRALATLIVKLPGA